MCTIMQKLTGTHLSYILNNIHLNLKTQEKNVLPPRIIIRANDSVLLKMSATNNEPSLNKNPFHMINFFLLLFFHRISSTCTNSFETGFPAILYVNEHK